MDTTLFRPVGLNELALIWDTGRREFPPRLPHQPIFYPVANREYARQIARDWDAPDEKSGFSGFVTSFELQTNFLANFEPHTVGSSTHVEYWIPADDLSSFSSAICGPIRLEEGFFGTKYIGYIPDKTNLKGKDAVSQFVALTKLWEYSKLDVAFEISANRKSVFLNWLFWIQHMFSAFDIDEAQKLGMLRNLCWCWEYNHIEIPLPQGLNR
jgi:hypothetical protein